MINDKTMKVKKYINCIYLGTLENSLKHGEGILIMETSRVYEGAF